MTVGITAVVSAIAVVQIGNTTQGLKGDSAMRVVLSQMNQAREMAITQRRYIRVTFDTVNTQVSLVREEINGTTTSLTTLPFEAGAMYTLTSGVPDTPDAFGNSAPTAFTSPNGTFASASGSSFVAKFAPDGTFIDWTGKTANGTVFTALPNVNLSARAVTVLGSTGRIRGYRWNGSAWVMV